MVTTRHQPWPAGRAASDDIRNRSRSQPTSWRVGKRDMNSRRVLFWKGVCMFRVPLDERSLNSLVAVVATRPILTFSGGS
jgi:hypothetical protein